ncbi:MAG: hypothetical protein R3B96_17710 [Pirellulaceae bacterium]
MSRYFLIACLAFCGTMPMIGCDASVEQIEATDGEAAAPTNYDKAREDQMSRGQESHGE